MVDLARERKGKCLSKKYISTHTQLKWECKNGHRFWKAPILIIHRNQWCKECKSDKTFRRIKKKLASKGDKCLSKFYNYRKKLIIQCKNGHKFSLWPANILKVKDTSLKKGSWCKQCFHDRIRKSLEEVEQLAKEHGGVCLAKKYKNRHIPIKWKCGNGHIFKSSVSNVQHGEWCPDCSPGLGERICRAYFCQLFQCSFPKSRPDWLKSAVGTQLELDGYAKELKLAFEYQGLQHYSKHPLFHSTRATLKKQQIYDKRKRMLCKLHGVALVEVPQFQKGINISTLRPFIREKCLLFNVDLPKYFDQIKVDLKKAYTPKEEELLDNLRAVAASRSPGGKLLSKHYLGVDANYEWWCGKKKHSPWLATAYNVIKSVRPSWCPQCKGDQIAERMRNRIEDVQKEGEKHGLTFMAITYHGIHGKLKWKCIAKGHEFECSLNCLRVGGRYKSSDGEWCKMCRKDNRKSLFSNRKEEK